MRGDGGGSTNEVGRKEDAPSPNDCAAGSGLLNANAGSGSITSVSYASWTLMGEAREERRETRVPLRVDERALPTLMGFEGDLRGDDFFGEWGNLR